MHFGDVMCDISENHYAPPETPLPTPFPACLHHYFTMYPPWLLTIMMPAPCRMYVFVCVHGVRLAAERDGCGTVHRSVADIHDAISNAMAACHPEQRPAPTPTACKQSRGAGRRSGGGGSGGCGGSDGGGGDDQRCCLALRDYYPFWRSRLETAEAGKLVPVDFSENTPKKARRLFLSYCT